MKVGILKKIQMLLVYPQDNDNVMEPSCSKGPLYLHMKSITSIIYEVESGC